MLNKPAIIFNVLVSKNKIDISLPASLFKIWIYEIYKNVSWKCLYNLNR
jgi:hypothetical protein